MKSLNIENHIAKVEEQIKREQEKIRAKQNSIADLRKRAKEIRRLCGKFFEAVWSENLMFTDADVEMFTAELRTKTLEAHERNVTDEVKEQKSVEKMSDGEKNTEESLTKTVMQVQNPTGSSSNDFGQAMKQGLAQRYGMSG